MQRIQQRCKPKRPNRLHRYNNNKSNDLWNNHPLQNRDNQHLVLRISTLMYGSNSNLDVLTKKITQQISEFLNKKYILGII